MSGLIVLVACIFQSLFTLFFMIMGVCWGLTEGQSIQRQTSANRNILVALYLFGVLGGVLSVGMLIYGIFFGRGSHYYFYLIPPWFFAGLYFHHYDECVKASKAKMARNPKSWRKRWRQILELPSLHNSYEDGMNKALWSASEDKQAACFAVLPYGNAIYARVQQLNQFETDTSMVSDDELLSKLDQQEVGIQQVMTHFLGAQYVIGQETLADNPPRQVFRGIGKATKRLRRESFSLMYPFQAHLRDIVSKYAGEEGEDVFLFVRKVLSQRDDIDRITQEWILWAIIADQFEVDPYRQALEFKCLGAESLWQANGGRLVFVHESKNKSEGKAVA